MEILIDKKICSPNTVNGPAPSRVSTKPAAVKAVTSVEQISGFPTAISTTLLVTDAGVSTVLITLR